MRRRVFSFAAAMSLLLCVATAVLWFRSYWRSDAWSWGTHTGRAGIESFRGRLTLGRVDVPPAGLARIPRGQLIGSVPAGQAASTMLKPSWSIVGLQVTRVNQGGYRVLDVRISHWVVLLATGLLLIVFLLKPRPVPPGCCASCGYNLTANTTGVCPECGMAVGSNAVAPPNMFDAREAFAPEGCTMVTLQPER